MANAMLISALIVGSLMGSGSGKAPTWLDLKVAGYALKFDDQNPMIGVHDAKSGFYLVRGVECDGAHLRVTLTRDRKIVSDEGYQIPGYKPVDGIERYLTLKEKPLSTLSTGKGIKIGDSPQRVRTLLGAATKTQKTGSRKQFDEMTYFWRDVKNGEGWEWTNTYTFKGGKLIEISFNREAVPGC